MVKCLGLCGARTPRITAGGAAWSRRDSWAALGSGIGSGAWSLELCPNALRELAEHLLVHRLDHPATELRDLADHVEVGSDSHFRTAPT